MAAWGASAGSQVKEIVWGTSAVGSSGHKALIVLSEVLNREMPNYRVTVQPTPGAIVTVKGYATGQYEGYSGAVVLGVHRRGWQRGTCAQPGQTKKLARSRRQGRIHRAAAVGRSRPSRACLQRSRREAPVPPG